MRIGTGHDIHALIPSIRKAEFPVGGVAVPTYFTVDAYSDGDVLLHAITDACLGAMALGDIGTWFPDSAAENRDRKSADFVTKAVSEIHRLGWRVGNIDCTVHLEEPKMAPFTDAIRKNVAQLLHCELSDVSVKFKTAEGLGPVGERRAITCEVIVLVTEK